MITTSVSSATRSAIASLRSVTSQVETLQQQISTGKRVSSARDDAAAWSLSVGMNSDIAANIAVIQSLSNASATVSIASAAASGMSKIMEKMSVAVTQAESSGLDAASLKAALTGYLAEVDTLSAGAEFRGTNLLDGSVTGNKDFLSGINGSDVSYISVTGQKLTTASGGDLAALKTMVNGIIGATTFASMRAAIDTASKSVLTASTALGAAENRIDIQGEFLGKLNDNLKAAVSALTDTDMEEASARLSALTTQQNLAASILTISSSQQQGIIQTLFARI